MWACPLEAVPRRFGLSIPVDTSAFYLLHPSNYVAFLPIQSVVVASLTSCGDSWKILHYSANHAETPPVACSQSSCKRANLSFTSLLESKRDCTEAPLKFPFPFTWHLVTEETQDTNGMQCSLHPSWANPHPAFKKRHLGTSTWMSINTATTWCVPSIQTPALSALFRHFLALHIRSNSLQSLLTCRRQALCRRIS